MNELGDKSVVGQSFERVLWKARWAVLLAVVCSVLAALVMFYISAVDTFYAVQMLADYHLLNSPDARGVMRAEAVGMVVKVIDIFLLAIVLMIFGLGMYELYISKIDHAYENHDESAVHMLSVNSLDDLKSRLGKVIMMVLIVKFFEMAIGMDVDGIQDLLIFSGGIMLIGLTLFLTEMEARTKGEW
ncbi:MAG: YqhA family protein, partial [Mariprofundus sp.]